MGAERSSVAMQLIDHDIFQISKNKIKPVFTVIRQERRVQHLRVGQNNIRVLSDPAALRLHRIAVIDTRRNSSFSKVLKNRLKRPVLIRRKCFRRIDKYRSGERIVQNRLQHRKQKTQRLPAGC